MAETKEIWIAGGGEDGFARDLRAWTDMRRLPTRVVTELEMESPQWQLADSSHPALVFLDGRGMAERRPTRVDLQEWLALLRDRVEETPIFLVLARIPRKDLCSWGRFGATDVLATPTPEDLDALYRQWIGKRDRIRGAEDVPLLNILRETCAAFSVPHSTPDLWMKFLKRTLRQFRAQSGSILLLTDDRDELIPLAAIGLPAQVAGKDRLPLEGSITSKVIREDKALLLQGNLKRIGMISEERKSRPASALAVPLRFGREVIGSFNVARVGEKARRFRRNELLALEVVGTQVALGVMNLRLIGQVRDNERLVAVGRTTADISHSVKNILTGLLGSVYLLERGHESNDHAMLGESLVLLRRSVSRLNLMIGDLLDFSKRREPDPEPCRLQTLLEELERQIAHRCRQQAVEFVLALPDDLPTVMVEEDRLFRALMNLTGNALDTMPAGGTLEVGALWRSVPVAAGDSAVKPASFAEKEIRIPGELQIEVADSGPGVPEELRKKIFEEFFSTKGARGTGLGLAMVNKFVGESKGRIEVRNRPAGGALFSMTLPSDAVVTF